MAQLINTTGPYWAKPVRYSAGRDHLGMQGTSVATYSNLLIGLTNLTKRLRYYSFYPWLIEMYAQKIGTVSKTKIEFYDFIRKGEFLFGFCSLISEESNESVNGIPGSLFIRQLLNKNKFKDTDEINLNEYASVKNIEKSYWKNKGGAFTQYYIGQLYEMEIIKYNEHDLPIITNRRGKSIYDAFDINFDKPTKEKFISCILNGKVEYSFIKELNSKISCDKISNNTLEHELLYGYILKNDIQKKHHSFRVNTIKLILNLLNNDKHIDDWDYFQRVMYFGKSKNNNEFNINTSDESVMCWKIYQLNEYMHYSLENIMHYLINTLIENNNWVSIDDVSESIISKIKVGITKLGLDIKINIENYNVNDMIDSFTKYNNNIWGSKGSPEYFINKMDEENLKEEKSLASSVCLILCLISRHKSEINILRNMMNKNGFYRQRSFLDIFYFYSNNERTKFLDFLREVIKTFIIDRHLEVAYLKIAAQNNNTLKFLHENNLLLGIESIPPKWTNPRVASLLSFLIDLGVIYFKDKYYLTEFGETIN